MRIRSTKPEFWRSERIASVDWDARLVLKGLESYVDDNGVGKDDIALIVSDVFPRDLAREPSRVLARVSASICALETAGLVHRYEVDGTRLLYIAFWEQVQRVDRPGKGRFRRPDGTLEYGESEIRESLASPREGSRDVATGAVEQGIRRTGEQENRHTPTASAMRTQKYPPDFEAFWSHYPRKVGKDRAVKAWRAATRNRATATAITAAAERMSRDPNLPAEEFIPHPTTWLNRGGWSDPPFPPRNGTAKPSTTDQRVTQGLDLMRRFADQEAAQHRTELEQ